MRSISVLLILREKSKWMEVATKLAKLYENQGDALKVSICCG